MSKTKKTTITQDQAEELESLIGDFLAPDPHGFGNPKRDIQDLLRSVGAPKDVVGHIFLQCQTIIEDVKCLEDEITRGNAETVADGCKHLDEYLEKVFVVTPSRGRGRVYKWAVWS